MQKRTKIIATIGPSSSSPAIIAKLIRAGMDAARLNFSHGDWSDHTKRIRVIRQEAEKAGKQIAIIQDLQGPKLRVGVMQNDAVTLRRGDAVTVTTKKVTGTNCLISVTYPRLTKDLKTGATMLLDDGSLELKVVRKSSTGLTCKVVRGGVLKSHKGVNLPGARLSLARQEGSETYHRDSIALCDARHDGLEHGVYGVTRGGPAQIAGLGCRLNEVGLGDHRWHTFSLPTRCHPGHLPDRCRVARNASERAS